MFQEWTLCNRYWQLIIRDKAGQLIIDIGIDVDSAKEYIQAKSESMLDNLINDLDEVLKRHRPW